MENQKTFTVRVTGYRGCIRVFACTPYHAKQKAISSYSHIDSSLFYVQPPIPFVKKPSVEDISKKW